jgi:hypothetical protein
LRLRPDECPDAFLSGQSQAQQLAFSLPIDVKIEEGQHVPSAATQSANSASVMLDGLNWNFCLLPGSARRVIYFKTCPMRRKLQGDRYPNEV